MRATINYRQCSEDGWERNVAAHQNAPERPASNIPLVDVVLLLLERLWLTSEGLTEVPYTIDELDPRRHVGPACECLLSTSLLQVEFRQGWIKECGGDLMITRKQTQGWDSKSEGEGKRKKGGRGLRKAKAGWTSTRAGRAAGLAWFL